MEAEEGFIDLTSLDDEVAISTSELLNVHASTRKRKRYVQEAMQSESDSSSVESADEMVDEKQSVEQLDSSVTVPTAPEFDSSVPAVTIPVARKRRPPTTANFSSWRPDDQNHGLLCFQSSDESNWINSAPLQWTCNFAQAITQPTSALNSSCRTTPPNASPLIWMVSLRDNDQLCLAGAVGICVLNGQLSCNGRMLSSRDFKKSADGVFSLGIPMLSEQQQHQQQKSAQKQRTDLNLKLFCSSTASSLLTLEPVSLNQYHSALGTTPTGPGKRSIVECQLLVVSPALFDHPDIFSVSGNMRNRLSPMFASTRFPRLCPIASESLPNLTAGAMTDDSESLVTLPVLHHVGSHCFVWHINTISSWKTVPYLTPNPIASSLQPLEFASINASALASCHSDQTQWFKLAQQLRSTCTTLPTPNPIDPTQLIISTSTDTDTADHDDFLKFIAPLDSLSSSATPSQRCSTIAITGGQNTGKSSLCRFLANSLDSTFWIDLDCGQNEFSAPGFVSVARWTDDILSNASRSVTMQCASPLQHLLFVSISPQLVKSLIFFLSLSLCF